jgi:hypothetical protein
MLFSRSFTFSSGEEQLAKATRRGMNNKAFFFIIRTFYTDK